MVVVFVVGFVFVLNMYIPGVLFRSLPVVSGIRDNVFCFYSVYIRRIPRELCFRGIWF